MPVPFLEVLNDRVLILDGGMGTSLHRYKPTDADWGYSPDGKSLMNLSDALALTRPDWIREIHKGYFAVGCDAVETNTFNANTIALGEFGMAHAVAEINKRNVRLAKEAAAEFSTPARPRYVVGSIGPGTKMPSVLNESIYADFDTVAAAYRPQVEALIEAGVDALLIETCFDILQAKCVTITANEVMQSKGVRVPLMVQITVDDRTKGQTLLPGTEVSSAITTLLAVPGIDVLGLNCSVGPDLMLHAVQQLTRFADKPVSVLPNAGLPLMKDGETYFPLQPAELADWLERFVTEYGVGIVGGCCGTTAEHLKAVIDRVGGRKPAPRTPTVVPAVSSLFNQVELHQEPRPLLIGERTNTNGSRKFKQLLEKEDWHGLVEMGQEQEREGVHVIDVCTAYVGRDEVRDMRNVLRRFNAIVTKPLMIDSTEVPVIEESLKLVSGKPIINSVNLEEGRHKFDKIVGLARKYGAALVCGCIDERGMARTAETKFEVAARIYEICTKEYGLPPYDLIFDPLVLPVSTGQEEERRNGFETLDGIRRIKQGLPGALTTVGLSNVSFGLSPYTRQVVNSVFLHYGVEFGLDSAILHAAKIIPLAQIDEKGRELARRLLFAEYDQGDPLQQLIEHYADKKAESKKGASLGETVEDRLKQAIIQGRRESLIADLDQARTAYSPIDIINRILLDGMKVVGDLFGAGQMQLPFVLQSAEVMKSAVANLEQYMEKVEGSEKGKIVLATVKGDVHDIGKNLVDIILTNNGYKVYNLGIKQPVENMIAAFQEHTADAIGMSGLLVKSTVIMKEDLQTLNERGLKMPVILGGAALTRRYVEEDLTRLYQGNVFYGEDAFAGLRIMDELVARKKLASVGSAALKGIAEASKWQKTGGPARPDDNADKAVRRKPTAPAAGGRECDLPPAPNVPKAPFLGSRVRTDIDMRDVFRFLNERTLFSTQWQFRKGGVAVAEYERQMTEVATPALRRLQDLCLAENILRPAIVYGFYPCAREGDDLVVFREDGRQEWVRFAFPRQDQGEFLCLSDYFRPADGGKATDVVGFMGVTMGREVTKVAQGWYEAGKYQDYLYLHGLGVESAEALAEWAHQQIRRELGIGGEDSSDVQKLFKGHYRGCRYSFGYPACPNLEDQAQLFQLLEPERIGLTLSEQFQLEPEQSTTAMIVHHPAAKYFNVTRPTGCEA
jgi:5-methyltetrahydrofolate--homocysteine methyltransferase